ncbi:MAG TPA: hypothetical protein VJX10_07050, partial [Pseudonocardiaceae bacterium]|nr:hypothetical protein [Pseudonocardiaceae bacterium]
MPARPRTAPITRPARNQPRNTPPRTLPAIPTPIVSVELSDLRRRGAPLAVLVGCGPDQPWFGPGTEWLPETCRVAEPVTGKAGELWTVPEPTGASAARWLAGVGRRGPADWRTAGATLVRSIQDCQPVAGRPRAVDVGLPADVTPDELTAFTLGLRLGGYRFRVTGDRSDEPRLRTVRLWLERPPTDALHAALARASAHASATALARDLANTPSNVKDPAWLAGTAARVAADLPGLTVTVRDEQWLAEQGFGGVLAVGSGSASPPRLVELGWRPRRAT